MALELFRKIRLSCFDDELEALYQADLRDRLFNQVKLSILLGASIFLVFSVMDLIDSSFDLNKIFSAWKVRSVVTPIGLGVWIYLEKKPEVSKPWIFHFALFGAIISVLGLFELLVIAGTATFFIELQKALMIVFIFVFGPLSVPVKPGLLFCSTVIFIMLIFGINLSVPTTAIIELIFDLVVTTIVLAFSRHQLDILSRWSFMDKRKANEERLLAEQATLEKTEFLRNASHNLRQPMQAITSYTSALESAFNNHDLSSVNKTIKGLACSVDLLADSFNKILDISNIDNGNYEPNISNVSINQLLRKIQQYYAPLATRKGIKLKIVIREKNPLTIYTDEHLLDQIIGNLVDNAIKYTQSGWVLVSITKIKRIVRIHVIDTGIGIPIEYREKIFEPFYRINEQSEEQGCGIGLSYINKTIQKLPKHQLEFYSKFQIGTHFIVYAPIAESPNLSPHSQENDTRHVPNKFILLIDDNKAVLNALGEQLKSQNFLIETALSLPEANRILENHLAIPDLIITDFKLRDGETAEDVIRCAQGFCKQIPVIVISGEPTTNKTIHILGNEYIVLKKPINNSLLLKAISQVLK